MQRFSVRSSRVHDYIQTTLIIQENSLEYILNDPEGAKLFKLFLDEEKSSEHILFWMEVEIFKTLENPVELKQRANYLFEKFLKAESSNQINLKHTVFVTIQQKMQNNQIDSDLFTAAQKSIFNLLEQDSYPRFLQSDHYQSFKEITREKKRENEDLTYLIARMIDEEKGVKISTRFENGKFFPECFVASEFISWMIQTLYLLNRKVALDLGVRLQEKGIIACSYVPPLSETSPIIDPKKEVFSDNNSLWVISQVKIQNEFQRPEKNVEAIIQSLPYKNCERKFFSQLSAVPRFLSENLDILTHIVSSWAIPRTQRNEFATSLVKIFYTNNSILPLIRTLLEKNFQQPGLGTLKLAEHSTLNKILDSYFELMSRDYIKAVLSPLFTKKLYETEWLCFDLRSEEEDQNLNRREFLKALKLILDPMFSLDILTKLPPEIREVASYIAEFSNSYAPEKTLSLVASFLLRPICTALSRPNSFGLNPQDQGTISLPLPKVRENINLIIQIIESIIQGTEVNRSRIYQFLNFTNPLITEKKALIQNFLNTFSVKSSDKASPVDPQLTADFHEYATLVSILYQNKENLENIFFQDVSNKTDNLFSLLKTAYTLITQGNEASKLKFSYCPVFSNSKFVWHFCLQNHIDLISKKIDYRMGDLEQNPTFHHGYVKLIDGIEIIRYLTGTFCVPSYWYPLLDNNSNQETQKRRERIDYFLTWGSENLEKPLSYLFSKEILPLFTKTPTFSKDNLEIENILQKLEESLRILDTELQDKLFLVGSSISVADLYIAETISTTRLFLFEALQLGSYINVWKWLNNITQNHIYYWYDVNVDFHSFIEYMTVAYGNEGVSSLSYVLSFNTYPGDLYTKLAALIGEGNTPKLNEPTGIPERFIIPNFKSEHIPPGHFSMLECILLSKRGIGNSTRLEFNLINLPPNKVKILSEKWMKVWKQLDGTYITQWGKTLFAPVPVDVIWQFFISSSSEIVVHIVESVANQKLVLGWRLFQWPENYLTQLTYTFKPLFGGTLIQLLHDSIPQEKLKEVKHAHKQNWKKFKLDPVESLEEDVLFTSLPEQVFESIKSVMTNVLNCPTQLSGWESKAPLQCSVDFKYPEWNSEHKSKATMRLLKTGGKDLRTKKGTRLVLTHESLFKQPKQKGKNKIKINVAVADFWEKTFWKKLNGIVITSFKQSLFFNQTSPTEVYMNLMNLGKFTPKKCVMTAEVGEDFSLFDDTVQGTNSKLIKNSLIVQKWRQNDWPEGHFSTVRIFLKPLIQIEEKDKSLATKLFLTHDGIPFKNLEATVKYWEKLWKKFQTPTGEIAPDYHIRKKNKIRSNSQTLVSGKEASFLLGTSISPQQTERHKQPEEKSTGKIIQSFMKSPTKLFKKSHQQD